MLADFRQIVKNRNFVSLWASQVLSQLTINIINFLLLIRLYNQTGSTIATSLLWVSFALPAIIVGPFAAAYVDMTDKRKMLIVSNILQSATIYFYAISHRSGLFLLYGVVILYSFFNQFYVPAEFSALPSLIKKKSYAYANGLFFLTQTVSLIVGFSLASILNNLLGFTRVLYLCSFFLFIAFVSVWFLPKIGTSAKIPKAFDKLLFKFFKRIAEGYYFIKEKKKIRYPFLLLLMLQISLAVVTVNIPEIALEILKVSVNSSGIFLGLPVGLGAMLGGLTIPKFMRNGWRKKSLIDNFLALIVLLIFSMTFVLPELPSKLSLLIGMIVIFAIGYAFIGILIPAQTFIQEETPGGFRGRVFGNFWFLVTIATILPVIFSGTLTELFNIRLLFFIMGSLTLTLYLLSKKYGDGVIKDFV